MKSSITKLSTLIIILSIIFSACTQSIEKQESKTDTLKVTSDTIAGISSSPTYYDYKNTSISTDYCDTAYAKFSDDANEDRFVVFVPKGLVKETKSVIRVTNKEGEIIYEHVFPTSDLVNGYATEEIKTDKEMEKYIIEEAKEILHDGLVDVNKLSDESYIKQATKQDFQDYEVFTELKTSGKVLFHYCLNEESHFYLGYSIKQKKTVTVIDCC